jgi:hypothetical protein
METIVQENPFDTQQAAPTNTGIVGGAMTQQPATNGQLPSNVGTSAPVTSNVATYNPTMRQVSQPTETVQGQVNSILSKDSPLMARARTLATQQMAQRGLVNSSMAQGAGVAAMIDRATPIAAQDANTYSQAASENVGALNTAGQFNASEINKFSLQTAQQNFQSAQADLERAQQVAMADKSFGAQKALQDAQQVFQSAQSELDRVQQMAISDKSLAGQLGIEEKRLSGQMAIADKEYGLKMAMNDAQIKMAEKELAGKLQLQAGQLALTREEIAQRTAMQKQEIEARSALAAQEANSRAALATQELQSRAAQAEADRQQQLVIAQKNLEAQQSLQTATQAFQATQAQLERSQQESMLKLSNDLSKSNVSTNFATSLTLQASNAINAISADPNLTPEAKRGAIQNAIDASNSTLAWGSTFFNTSIPPIRTPG